MFNLPTEIINLIYSFDGTKRANFNKVLEELTYEYNKSVNKVECGYTFRGCHNWILTLEEITNDKLGLDEHRSYVFSYLTDNQFNYFLMKREFNDLRNQMEEEGEVNLDDIHYPSMLLNWIKYGSL